jgi:hypothetical protein
VTARDALLRRFNWSKVEAPSTWSPKKKGDALVGYYVGRTKRNGPHGQYEVAMVAVPGDGVRVVSGVRILQLLDVALLESGHPVQIVYLGTKDTAGGHAMRLFDLLVAEGDPLDASDVAALGGAQ